MLKSRLSLSFFLLRYFVIAHFRKKGSKSFLFFVFAFSLRGCLFALTSRSRMRFFGQTLLPGFEGGMARGFCLGDMEAEQRVAAWGSQTIQGP